LLAWNIYRGEAVTPPSIEKAAFGELTTHLLESSKCSMEQIDHLADRLYLQWSLGERDKVRDLAEELGIIQPDWYDFSLSFSTGKA
jgi:hypothetical protein